jgi:radical SAM protein with 4Fe4S-binding SPASM domain
MKQVLDEFAALGTTGIGFTGGEPLLRSDIFTLLQHSKARGMITHLNTNGFLLTPDRIQRLLEIGIDSINISVDGATAATHEAARGVPGGFQRILDGIKFLLEERKHIHRRVTVNIVSVISQHNLHEIADLVRLATSQKVDGIGFLPIHGFYNEFEQDRATVMSNAQWQETTENKIDSLIAMKQAGCPIENSLRYLRLFTRCFRGEPLPIACYAGYNSYVVHCYGDIFPCVPWNNWNRAVQNIKHVSLKDFWFSRDYDRIRKTQVNSCRECYWNCHTEMNLLFHPFASL